MYFDALNNFSSMHFVYWKPLKVGNRPRHRSVNLPNIYKKLKKKVEKITETISKHKHRKKNIRRNKKKKVKDKNKKRKK